MTTDISTIAILPVPFSPDQALIALAVLIPVLLLLILLFISAGVFESIGFRFYQAVLVTAGALFGSLVNIPLIPVGEAIIAVNVGGADAPPVATGINPSTGQWPACTCSPAFSRYTVPQYGHLASPVRATSRYTLG